MSLRTIIFEESSVSHGGGLVPPADAHLRGPATHGPVLPSEEQGQARAQP